MLGREVEFESSENPTRLIRGKRLVERHGLVSAEIVEHDPDEAGIRVVDIDEVTHLLGEVDVCAPVGDLDVLIRSRGCGGRG